MRWTDGLAGALAGSLVYQAMPGQANVADVDPAEVSSSVSAYLAAHPISTRKASQTPDTASLKAAVLANTTSPISHAARSRCPVSCSESGLDSTAWSVYHRLERLDLCDSPMLLDFNLFNELDNPRTHLSLAACSADFELSSSANRETTNNTSCLSNSVSPSTVTSSIQLASSGSTSSIATADVVNLLEQLQAAFAISQSDCKERIQVAYTDKAAVGVYLGSALSSQGVILPVLDKLITQVQTYNSIAQETIVQLCNNSTARYSLGVFVSTNADLSSTQQAIQSWRNSGCLTTMEEWTPDWDTLSFLAPSSRLNSSLATNSTRLATRELLHRRTHSDKELGHAQEAKKLQSRDDSNECTTIQVVSGDSCSTLATECGITAAEFTKYNPSSDLCSTLVAGQHVCCTAGDLPNYAPQPDSDDNCYSYTVKTGDTCSALAAAYDITVDEIEAWNTGSNGTWGWMGCSDLLVGSYICLSDGWPPMPANVPNAVCGPQVNNTSTAPHGTDLATLNECPLNACCDIWGECGITADFCTPSNSTTGNPGTAASGENGCISNCGASIIVSDAPAETYSIAYFEGSDQTRSCLAMSVDQVNTTFYTHIHFAFATINSDMTLNVDGMEDQLSLLSNMTGVKRILSIGGWDFSTGADTYMIFRDAVTSANRDTLVSNVVDFLDEYDLDGVDFDWEYPDEPDIPGIPAGTTADATNYYLTLLVLKEALPSDKTLSITAPASFWYLERFPIEAIASVVDYIVYMTYDLHGQWDYGNAFADSGCDNGNCLRSHVNLTETLSSLSMITKAGVSSNKVAVGVASYARSFEMTEAGCWTDMCTYTGPSSGAWPGPCTDTAGYIANYELELVMAENPTAELYWDDNSYSNILVFNETQWAGYMNDTNKAVRATLYELLTFLGSVDWAVDLQSEDGNEDQDGSGVIYIDPIIFNEPSPTVAGYPPFIMVWPTSSLATPMVVNFPPYPLISYEGGLPTTSWVAVPSTTVSQISFFQWEGPPSGIPTTTFNLVSSFSPPPVTLILPGDTFPTTLYPPPIESPYTPQVGVVGGSSYTVFGGTITLNGGGGTSLVTGLPSPAATTQTVTETVFVEGSTATTPTVVVVILPTAPAVSLTENTLTSTISTSGSVTFTWMEEQIDSLATIDSTTTITTTTAKTSIVIPVNTGGFYWSPVSNPDIPVPTVNPPELPPIPDVPCFTLFDIFTIDCPPNKDKSQKTTHYTSAKGSPTCSPSTASSCGKFCTSNCDASSTSTTSTSTTCISKSAVTDYWVSCDGTACSTTSSAQITGCDVTATTTTTGSYCLASGVDVWSTDDQGEEGARYYTATTTTIPEEIVAAGTTYVVGANGAVTLGNGDVITVPTETAGTTVLTIGSNTITVDPAVETIITVVAIGATSAITTSSVSTTHAGSTTTTTLPPTTITVTPTPSATCYFWDEGWGYTFEVFGISGWVTDGGSSLHHQEDGCGALTGWSWTAATSTTDAYVYFNLPFFIKAGCVERAIVSAGGPKISCQGQGLAKRRESLNVGVPPSFTEEENEAFKAFYANATTYYPYEPMIWAVASITESLITSIIIDS